MEDRSLPVAGNCNETDGVSVCTESSGHGPVHWDRPVYSSHIYQVNTIK
jgi:hypothetical protein